MVEERAFCRAKEEAMEAGRVRADALGEVKS